MKLKLNIERTRVVTTDDMRIFCGAEPLRFEAVSHIPNEVHGVLLDWTEAGRPADKAAEIAPRLFRSVSQNGTSYPIAGPEGGQALREALGDELLRDVIEEFWNYDARFFAIRRRGFVNSQPPPENGESSEA